MAPRDPKHFAYIDAVRGLAFLAVLMVHSVLCVGQFPLSDLLKMGGYGVQLFFLASAITLCNSMAARSKVDRFPVLAFYIRRVFRIAPLFWLAMVFYTLFPHVMPEFWLGQWAPHGVQPSYFVQTGLFLHGWFPYAFNSIVPGGWSIAVEMTFYLIFPFLFHCLNSMKRAALGVLGVILWLKLVGVAEGYLRAHVFAGIEPDILNFFFGLWFPRQLGVFVVGIFTYHFIRTTTGRTLAESPFWANGVMLLCLVVLPNFLLAGGAVPVPWLLFIVTILATMIVAISAYRVPWIVNPVICYIGKISYSCYLVHFAAVGMALKILGLHLTQTRTFFQTGHGLSNLLLFLAIFGLGLLFTVPMATVTLHLIENPGIALGKKFLKWIESKRK